MIGQTISHYKILEKLGEGGMGVVYKAQDLKLDRQVALKFLPEHLTADEVEKERFIHEAKAASALNHPNVTTIHEIDEHDGQLFIVMEYCPGQSVKDLIGEEKLTLKKTLDIAVQICEGLTAAHKKDVVHRDIKSDNIMVTPEGRVKIMDFGLAKLKGATKLTSTGSTLGTVSYMSPEQAQTMEVDQRSDIFSFGVVLYEMITGHLPFRGDHEAAVIYSIVNEAPEPLARYKAEVPDGLQRIVDKALEKDREERYQHIDGVLADLRHEKRILESAPAGRVTSEEKFARSKKARLSVIVPVAVIFLAVLVFFILKPFQVKIGPQQEANAQENSLAIMYFENMVDPEDTDRTAQMITSLLMTDLSESEYMYVISRQRLYDILKSMGKEDLKVIDRTVASEVAKKAAVKWILTGSILRAEPVIVLTSDISDAVTGRILATQRITGQEGEDLFTVVDRLSAAVKQDLSLPREARDEPDRPVADVTTRSPEAYRYYVEGMEYSLKYFQPEAMQSFERAIEHDSTFAMAHLQLAWLQWGTEQGRRHAESAARYVERASERDRYIIRSVEASFAGDPASAARFLKEATERYPDDKILFEELAGIYNTDLRIFDKAIEALDRAIEIDPLFGQAYNSLAYLYNEIGDVDRSVWAINKYISIAPDEPNPYDTRGDLYARNGRIDDAISSYEEAVRIKPDFLMSVKKLGDMALYKREYREAERNYKRVASSSHTDYRSRGRFCLALVPAYRGRFEEALRVLTDGLTADRMDQYEGIYSAEKHRLKAELYVVRKEYDRAVAEAEQCCQHVEASHPYGLVEFRMYQILVLAECGRFEEAERIAEKFRNNLSSGNTWGLNRYWISRAFIDLEQGAVDAAVSNLEKVSEVDRMLPFIASLTLARGYLGSGNLSGAVEELERALMRYDRDRTIIPTYAVRAHYFLGQAYERSGWTDKAIEQYETFLEIWKDADPGIEEVEDAKERLRALNIGS